MCWDHMLAAVGDVLPRRPPTWDALVPCLFCSGWLPLRIGSAVEQEKGFLQLGMGLEAPVVVPLRFGQGIIIQDAGRRVLLLENPLRGECHGIVPHTLHAHAMVSRAQNPGRA